MTSFTNSPTNYPQGSNTPVRRVKQDHAPSSTEIKNFILGDEWLDTSTGNWYKFCNNPSGGNKWSPIGGSALGKLNSLTGNTGGQVLPNSGNINIVGTGTTSVVGNPATNTLTVTTTSGGYPITSYVVGPAGQAGYQTIQSALDAAAISGSAQMIYIQPGTYTEDLVFPDINISLWGDRGGDSVIVGQHTPSASANLELHSLLLQSATNILNSNAAGTSSIEISDTFIIITNGYVFNLPNWTGEFLLDDCGEASTNDGVVNNTAGATIKFLNTEMGAGSSLTMTLTGNANVRFDTCNVNCAVNIAGSGTFIMQNGCKFSNTVTIGDSKSGTIVSTDFLTASNQSLTYNSSGNTYLSGVTINSSSDPSIGGTGVGTLTLSDVSFVDNPNIAATLTTSAGVIRGGNFVSQYIVGRSPDAHYQTIQSALDAANAAGGAIIIVHPGDYAENLTLYDACHILGATFADAGGGVNITGVHTPPTTGGFVFRNVRLISATHIFNSLAAGSSHLVLGDAEIFVTNGYTFNLPNWTGKLESFDVNAAVGTNDGYVNNTGGAEVDLFEVSVGSGSVNPMIISGFTLGAGANIYCPVNFSTGCTAEFDYSFFGNSITFSNNSTGTITTSHLSTGASAAITMSSSGAWKICTSIIDSTNNPAIEGSGAGTLTLSAVSFLSNSTLAGTLNLGSSNIYPVSMTNGQLLIGSTGQTAIPATLTAGANVSITNGAGSITISTSPETFAYTAVNTTPYAVLSTDHFIGVDSSGSTISIELPNTTTTGRTIYIKDSSGNAATNNINVTTVSGATTIDGFTTKTISSNYGALSLIFNGSSYEIF